MNFLVLYRYFVAALFLDLYTNGSVDETKSQSPTLRQVHVAERTKSENSSPIYPKISVLVTNFFQVEYVIKTLNLTIKNNKLTIPLACMLANVFCSVIYMI